MYFIYEVVGSVFLAGNCTSMTSLVEFGILCLVMSGMTLSKKAEMRIRVPARVKTTGDSLRIFISASKTPVMAPILAAPLQIPLQVILQLEVEFLDNE